MHRGDRIAGRFEILAEAGRGGMGTVFRARDRKDRREVALKVLTAEVMRHAPRFEREAAILSGLRHPNIVEYVAHGATPDGLHYLVMEWVEGETLAQRLDATGLTAAETVAMATQVARGLAALHAAGVVHRDLKPSNLMLVGGAVDAVKIVDFGVARRVLEPSALTRTGMMVGTAGYMAPEQARGAHGEVDGRADLFALGCILYEALTGAQPFPGESMMAVRAKVLLHEPVSIRLIEPQLPAALDALVGSLLAKHPAARPPDAADVESTLTSIGALPATAARPAHGALATTTPAATQADLLICAVLVADVDDLEPIEAAIEEIATATVEPLDGGAIVTVAGEPATAGHLALAIAERVPGTRVAGAIGVAPGEVIDRAARLLEQLDLEDAGPGAWLDAATARRIGPGFTVVAEGDRVRVAGRTR